MATRRSPLGKDTTWAYWPVDRARTAGPQQFLSSTLDDVYDNLGTWKDKQKEQWRKAMDDVLVEADQPVGAPPATAVIDLQPEAAGPEVAPAGVHELPAPDDAAARLDVDTFVQRLDPETGLPELNALQQRAVTHILYRLEDYIAYEDEPNDSPHKNAMKQQLEENPLSLLIIGPAGTGKSRVVKNVAKYYAARKVGGRSCRCLLGTCAPTGVTAANLGPGSCTSCRMFGDRENGKNQQDEVDCRARGKQLIILDEFAMLSIRACGNAHLNLGKITKRDDLDFGGIEIVFSGDFNQLPPVSGHSLMNSRYHAKQACPDLKNKAYAKQIGAQKFEGFDKAVVLEEIFRQADDPVLMNLLNHVSEGECTVADIGRLNQMTGRNLSAEEWRHATVITVDNRTRIALNHHRLRRDAAEFQRPILVAHPPTPVCHATQSERNSRMFDSKLDNGETLDALQVRKIVQARLKRLTAHDFQNNIEPEGLRLMIGMPVIVTDNNADHGGSELGVANGTPGTVVAIIPHLDDRVAASRLPLFNDRATWAHQEYHLTMPPLCVLVRVDTEYRADLFANLPGLPSGTVPIFPRKFTTQLDIGREWLQDDFFACTKGQTCTEPGHTKAHKKYALEPKDKHTYHSYTVTLEQFPLMPAYAVTDYKAQGRTMTGKVVVDLDLPSWVPRGHLAKLYVMLSRSKYRHNIGILNPVPRECKEAANDDTGPPRCTARRADGRRCHPTKNLDPNGRCRYHTDLLKHRHYSTAATERKPGDGDGGDEDGIGDRRCRCTYCVLTLGRTATVKDVIRRITRLSTTDRSVRPRRLFTRVEHPLHAPQGHGWAWRGGGAKARPQPRPPH
jgi:hypothetical protein